MVTVAVIGTCDTKLDALVFIKQTIAAGGQCHAIIIDVGIYDPAESSQIDIPRDKLSNPPSNARGGSRAAAAEVMTARLTGTLCDLYKSGKIAGVIGAGGSGNTSICTKAFRDALPIGFPKLMVSTMASGDISHYIRETDITMMYSVVDVAGMNSILQVVLANAARAIAGMASQSEATASHISSRPAIAVSMFGVTTPCVQIASRRLEELGYEVIVFHATGAGGTAMERLISENKFVGVLDITTTELADELVGGVLSAGPHRLEAAAKAGIPQVISFGAMDMVNFGPTSSVPAKFAARHLHEHNSSVTLMRTTREECIALGEIVARKANHAVETTRVILPLGGVSLIDMPGTPFYDPKADEAMFNAFRRDAQCPVVELDCAINDSKFALAAVEALHEMLETRG